ncbi:MAG: 50S ribosomal protein L18 [Bacteroidetes bacterium]|nr:50S ribosomal protein L18 [Bacteroidota bacterium]
MAKSKLQNRARVKRGIRGKIVGTADRPRLSVFRSNRYLYAQLIDDAAGHTLASVTTKGGVEGTPIEQGRDAGKRLAEAAKAAGVEAVVFDRNGYRYHGRVQALAEGAREGGLQF